MRNKRGTTRRATSLYFDKQADVNLKFITETTEALLGVKLSPSVIIRRSLELLADRWMNEAVDTLAGKSTAEFKMEKLSEFIKTEREEFLRAAGRQHDVVPTKAALQGKVY
jgi:hypothetical protein